MLEVTDLASAVVVRREDAIRSSSESSSGFVAVMGLPGASTQLADQRRGNR